MEYVQDALHYAKSEQEARKRQAEEHYDVGVAPEGITVAGRLGHALDKRFGRRFAKQSRGRLRCRLSCLRFRRSRWQLRIVFHHRPLSISAAASNGSISSW